MRLGIELSVWYSIWNEVVLFDIANNMCSDHVGCVNSMVIYTGCDSISLIHSSTFTFYYTFKYTMVSHLCLCKNAN